MLRFCLLLLAILANGLCSKISAQTFSANNTSGCTPMGLVISVTSPAAGSISSYLWTITLPDNSIQTASSSTYIAILTMPGAYDVSLTINGNQTNSISNYINVYEVPTANFTASDPDGCFPLCVDFADISIEGGGNIVEWSWDFGDGGTSTDQNPNYCYNQVGTFSPVFSVEDEHGCFADVTIPGLITVVNNFPNAQFTLSSQLDCNPPVNISMTNSSTGTSALTSVWNFDDGPNQTIAGTGPTSHNYTSVGTYDVCLTVTDDIGCQDQLCQAVTIFGTAQATYTVSTDEACEGETITFTSTTTPTPPQVQWDFDGNGTVDSTSPTATYSYANNGTYSPSLTVTYSGGCSDTENGLTTITVIDGVNVNFSADAIAACQFPFTVNFTNSSSGVGTIDYAWFVDNVQIATTDDFTYTFNSFGNFDIKLTATNAQGCVNVLTMVDYITVQPPVVDFNNEPSVCTDENVPLFDIVVTCVEPIVNYMWDFETDGTYDAFGLAPAFMYSSPGVYNITLTVESASGCTASYTNTQTINVLTNVDANFISSATVTCAGEPVEFCVTDQPGNTFSWNFFDGSGWVVMPMDESCILHDYTDTGYFDVQLTVFNGACSGSITFENFIYVSPPVALFEYSIDCNNLLGVSFINTSIEADSIVWDFGDGSPLLPNEENIIHEFPGSGEYTVTISAYNDLLGCPDLQSHQIVVEAPDATLTFDPPNGCPPLEVGLDNNSFNTNWTVEVSNGHMITANWIENQNQWQISYVHDGTTESFVFGNINSLIWPDLIIEEAGYYDVTVTVINQNGCESVEFYDDVIHVTSNPDFAAFTTTTIDACNNVQLEFEPVLPGLQNIQWIFSDGSVSTLENPLHTFAPPYNYDVPISATLTAEDSLGCVSSVSQTLDVIFPPMVDFIVLNDPSCQGDDVQFINESDGPDGTTYLWDFGDSMSAENTSADIDPTHLYTENGTYEICLTADNGAGCALTYCNPEAVHIVNPEVSFTYTSAINNCLYGVQFHNSTPGVVIQSQWDFGDGQSGFGTNAYHTYPIGVYDVTLTVVNQYGCVDSLVVPDILNYGNQVGPFTQALDSADCAPFDIQLTAFNPTDTYFDYFWDFNDGGGDPSDVTITNHTYLQPGTYCPSVIMTDPNGCVVLISCAEPIVVEEFVMAYSAVDYLCFGDTLHLSVGNGETYTWDDLSQITQGAAYNEFYLHPFDDTQFLLTGTYSDCVRTDTINIEVKDLPTVTLDIANSVCSGDDVFDLSGGLPDNPPGQYFIDGAVATQFDPNWPTEMAYQVTYQYTDTFSCVNSAIVDVYLHALPVIGFPDFADVCEDAVVIDMNTASPVGGVYTWGADTIVNFDPAIGEGLYDFIYTYTDQYNCTNEANAQLMVHPTPDLLIAFDDVCQDVGLQVQNLSTIPMGSIAQTQWNFGVAGTDSNFNHVPKYFPAIGNYPFSVTLTSDQNCVSFYDTTVNVWAVPVVQFTPHEACQFAPQLFMDESTLEADSITIWIWNVEGQTISSPDSLNYAFQTWGDLSVSLTPITNHGCDDTLTVNVVVHPAPVVDLIYSDGCLGIESQFHAETSVPIGGIISHEWIFGDTHPNEYDYDADNLYDTTGIYYITYTAVSNLGCTTVVNDSIGIYGIPEVDFIVQPNEMCAGTPFMMFDLSTVDAPSYIAEWQWYFDNTEVSTEQNADTFWTQPGTYDLRLVVTSNHGCANDSTALNEVTVYPRPTAGFVAPEQASMFNPVVEIINESSEDVTGWVYDFGDGNSAIFPEGEHLFEAWGDYLITQVVENAFGCLDTATQVVEITPDMLVYIPNAFTPDGNGHNEIFAAVTSGFDITLFQFMVFDRWGTQVFSSDDVAKGWDGTINGEVAQDGVYSWRLMIRSNFDVTIHEMMGNVTLLR